MVNTNIQSPVPLIGKGYTQRPNATYDNGEYPLFNNVFIKDEGMETRNGITGLDIYRPGSDSMDNPKNFSNMMGFIGYVTNTNINYLAAAGQDSLFTARQPEGGSLASANAYWGPTALQATQTEINFRVPIKAFMYQDRMIFVTMKAIPNAGNNSIASIEYHWGKQTVPGPTATVPASWNLIVSRSGNSVVTGAEDFINAFAWKDRIWLVTADTVYWSGIGTEVNQANFTVPVGGFIKYSGRIKSVEYLRDTLYVICENEIYTMTYNSDPNTDAVNLAVSTNQGGDSSCIHEGTVYFTDGLSLFTVGNGSVNKALDLELFVKPLVPLNQNFITSAWNQEINTKLVAYKNKIVFIAYDTSTMGTNTYSTPYRNRGIKVPVSSRPDGASPYTGPVNYLVNDVGHEFSNVFMIDTNNGSITKIMFRDQRAGNFNGYIVDAINVPDTNGNQKLYFMTSAHRTFEGSVTTYRQNTYNFIYSYVDNPNVFNSSLYNNKSWDTYFSVPFDNPAGAITLNNRVAIPFCALFYKFVPDGSQYLMKKFKSLFLTGSLPENTNVSTLFHDKDSLQAVPLIASRGDTSNSKSYRFPLNQRGRFLTLALSRASGAGSNSASNDNTVNSDVMTLRDMRMIWTYTSKAQRTQGGNVTVANPIV